MTKEDRETIEEIRVRVRSGERILVKNKKNEKVYVLTAIGYIGTKEENEELKKNGKAYDSTCFDTYFFYTNTEKNGKPFGKTFTYRYEQLDFNV